MANLMKVTGYLVAHDGINKDEVVREAGELLTGRFDCVRELFSAEEVELGIDFADEAREHHPLNCTDDSIDTSEDCFESIIKERLINMQKILCVNGQEFVPGDVIDYLSWTLDGDVMDEVYGAILRDITDTGIVVFDVVNGCDVFIPERNIVKTECDIDMESLENPPDF